MSRDKNIPLRIAITGLSCFGMSVPEPNNSREMILNSVSIEFSRIEDSSIWFKLAQAALFESGWRKDNFIEKTCIVVCLHQDIEEHSLIENIRHQLNSTEIKDIFFQKIKNPGQGVIEAAAKLLTRHFDRVLLIIADKFTGRSSICGAALVLTRTDDAITGDHIYASLLLMQEQIANMRETKLDLSANLSSAYRDAEINLHSVGILAVVGSSQGLTDRHIDSLSEFFKEKAKSESAGTFNRDQIWCSLREYKTDQKKNSAVVSLIETLLCLQQKVLLPTEKETISPIGKDQIKKEAADLFPLYLNGVIRPWFHPQVHEQFIALNSNLGEQTNFSSLRSAVLHFINDDESFTHLIIEEYPDNNEMQKRNLDPLWDSEVFLFSTADFHELTNLLNQINSYLNVSNAPLKDLAYTINARNKQSKGLLKVAVIASSVEELREKLNSLLQFGASESPFSIDTSCIYIRQSSDIGQAVAAGKLAFILPGLGSAYPDMLSDLCRHFPEIRAIFDFIDFVALSGGGNKQLSDRIFPRRPLNHKYPQESPASLAMMDSAVVAVLMAEWAIFTLFLNLGIIPDVLLGCSTGEFAAITMSGAIDIIGAAPLFYHLSTSISSALPINQLINLRSLKINAAFPVISSYMNSYAGKIHLSADLSNRQVLVTGDKESINLLAKALEQNNISADFLPFAIPYHTSLVANVVSPNNPDVLALQIDKPMIESWSCSLADKYPNNPEQIRKIATELFSKPILLRKSIESLYREGVRKFLEVGPRGNLAPVISETLTNEPHISIAANRQDVSTITQMHHTLALLFVNNTYMDLGYLYARRSPQLLPIFDQNLYVKADNVITDIDNIAIKSDDLQFEKVPSLEQPLVEEFRARLRRLEQETIAAIQSAQGNKAILENKQNHLNGSSRHYKTKAIAITELFPECVIGSRSNIVCREFREEEFTLDASFLAGCAGQILSPIEIQTFESFGQLTKRRQWLAGRLAVKEAARYLIASVYNIAINNTDLVVETEKSGKIYLKSIRSDKYSIPAISLSHKQGKIFAVAADSGSYSSVGVDLESSESGDNDMPEFILSPEELIYIENFAEKEKNIAFKKIWAAKEAAAKVLGLGLPDYLKSLSIIDCDKDISQITVKVAEQYKLVPDIKAYILSVDNMILALSFIKSSAGKNKIITGYLLS